MDAMTHVLSVVIVTEPIRYSLERSRLSVQADEPEQASLLRPPVAWRFYLAMGLAALLPDIDGALGVPDAMGWTQLGWYARYHRVITHSIPGLVFFAAVGALLGAFWPQKWMLPFVRRIDSRGDAGRRYSGSGAWPFLFLMALIGVTLHVIEDGVTAWGTLRLFWPVSDWDFQLNRVNSLEPWILAFTLAIWAVQHFLLQMKRLRAGYAMTLLWVLAFAAYVWLRPIYGPKPYV